MLEFGGRNQLVFPMESLPNQGGKHDFGSSVEVSYSRVLWGPGCQMQSYVASVANYGFLCGTYTNSTANLVFSIKDN